MFTIFICSLYENIINNGLLEDEIEYCQKLMQTIENNKVVSTFPSGKLQ